MSGNSGGAASAHRTIRAASVDAGLTRRASFSTPVAGGVSRPLRKSRAQSTANVKDADEQLDQINALATNDRPLRVARRDTWAGNLVGSSSARRLSRQPSSERYQSLELIGDEGFVDVALSSQGKSYTPSPQPSGSSRGDAAALPKFASVSDLSQKTLSALKRVSSDLNAASLPGLDRLLRGSGGSRDAVTVTSFEPVDLSSSTHTPHHHLPGGRLGGEIVEMAVTRRPNRRMLGFTIARLNDEVYANCVWKHWPAYKAGLRFGDQILRVNGHSVKGLTVAQIYARMESAGNSVMLRVRSHPLEQTNTMERRMVGGQLEKLGLTFFAGVIIRTVPGSPAARLGKDLIDHVLVAVNDQTVVGWKDVRTVEVFKAAGSIVSVTTMPQQTLKALLGNSLTGEQYQLLCYSSVVDMMVDRCLERNVDTTMQPDPVSVDTITSLPTERARHRRTRSVAEQTV